MKKIFICVAALSAFLFSGCFNPVFDNIEKEVELSEGNVQGIVNSIVRFNDASGAHLVCSNGETVFYKNYGTYRNADSDLSVWNAPKNGVFEPLHYDYHDGVYYGQYVLKTAADDKYVYILTTEIQDNGDGENESSGYHLYYADVCPAETGSWEWKTVEGSAAVIAEAAAGSVVPVTVFSTNDENVSLRAAFLRGKNNTVYKLDAKLADPLEASAVVMGDGSAYALVENKDDINKTVKSALATEEGIVFFTTLASVKGKDCYFYAADDTDSKSGTTYSNTDIYMKKNGVDAVKVYEPRTKSSGKNNGKPIMSMAVTDDYLIFGCGESTSSITNDGGIYHIGMDEVSGGTVRGDTDSFATNAASTLTQYYEVRSLIVEDSSKKEEDAFIFASATFKSAGNSISVSYENRGLWAYYPERGNWNRE